MMNAYTPGWKLHGLSVAGHRHVVEDSPCQDAWSLRADDNDDVFLLAVADGAGSRPMAREGSRLAVELVRERFAAPPGGDATGRAVDEYLRTEFRKIRRLFLQKAGERYNDYATTLTIVVHTPLWLGYLSVGDGFVVLRSGTEKGRPQFHLLPQPAPVSEYSNEAFFVTSGDVGKRLVTHCVVDPDITGIVMTTDGLTQAALDSPGNDRKRPKDLFVSKVLAGLERQDIGADAEERELRGLLTSSRLAKANADDKTLLRAVRA